MASGAVRELITKVRFQVDNNSLNATNNAIKQIKQKLNQLGQSRIKINVRVNSAAINNAINQIRNQMAHLNLNIHAQASVATIRANVVNLHGRINNGGGHGGGSGNGGGAVAGLGSGLAGVAGVIGGGMAISQIKDTADEMMNLDGRLRTVTKSETERLDIESELYKRAQESRQSMQAMGDLYFKVARASQEMGFAQQDNLRVTETVSKALVIGGASAQEASATILQLGQALGSGRLQGDELRSLDENASILMGHVAKYFNTTVAGLKEMGFAQQDNLRVTETVSKALVIGGANAQEANATILQLGQALGSGRLQGDELRSLDENASILMGHVAKYFKTSVAGLKQMGAQGELTSDEVMRAILSASGEIDKEFSKMPMTFGQSMNMMENSWDRFILGVEQKSSIFSLIARAFTKAFDSMGNKLNDVLTLLGTPDANKMVTITEATTGEQKQISETDYYNQKAAENPGLFQAIEGFKKLSEMFDELDGESGNLDEQIGGVIETLMEIGLVVVPILAVIGMIDALIALISPFITLVTSIGSTIMGALEPILSLGLGPLLAILAAIASVIYFVGENWETVVSWFQPGIDSIMEGIEQLQQAWQNLQPFIAAITPLLQAIATVVGGAIVGALSLLFRVASWVFMQIASFINWVAGLLGDLGNTIQWLADGLAGLLDKAAQFIGMKGQIDGVNSSITQKWADRSMGCNTNTQNINVGSINVPTAADVGAGIGSLATTPTYFAYD